MASDYDAICEANIRRYGTETAHLALLGDLYSERTHFILELLGDLRIPQFKKAMKLRQELRRIEGESHPRRMIVEPWPEPVDGAGLLQDIVDLITRHVVLPKESAAICDSFVETVGGLMVPPALP